MFKKEYLCIFVRHCPYCGKIVDEEKQLFVEENNRLYHLSCYNYKKAEEENE